MKAIYPYCDGGPITISVAATDYPEGTVDFDSDNDTSVSYTFDPTADYKFDAILGGRYFSTRFEDTSNEEWRLSGYNIEFVDRGDR